MLRKSLVIIGAVALVSALVPGMAAAQDSNTNQRTYFTFSAPVELPGKTLPAGTYLFKLVDSPSNRHIVQVFDKDEKQIHATTLAIPAQRLEPADEPEVRFMEVAASQPAAIRTWWFPGRTVGHEFIYPKEQATRLAKGAKAPVLTVATDANTADTMREAELARVNESAETSTYSAEQTPGAVAGTAVTGRNESQAAMTTANRESQTTANTAPTESQTAANTARSESRPTVNTPPPAQSAPTTVPQSTAVTQRPVETPSAPATSTESVQTTRTELPRTATILPFVALFGFGSLVGAAALRLRRK
jgi:FtsZ-interacting cell division protein ZipA